jgi:hypothetical protein
MCSRYAAEHFQGRIAIDRFAFQSQLLLGNVNFDVGKTYNTRGPSLSEA